MYSTKKQTQTNKVFYQVNKPKKELVVFTHKYKNPEDWNTDETYAFLHEDDFGDWGDD